MSHKLEEIRAYPEDRRRLIVLVSTISISLVIIVLWLANIWLIAPLSKSSAKSESVSSLDSNIKKEWQSIGLGFGLLLNTIKNQF